jgi:hypothetical protein
MTTRTNCGAILAMVAIATLSCSKTQDTAPERRVFGDPPTIESVNDNILVPNRFVECDFTTIVRGFLCERQVTNVEFIAGAGWPPDPSRVPSQEPGVFISGTYGEITLKAKVSDPNSPAPSPAPPAPTNILLVSASFPDPDINNKNETSLVLFDEGSTIRFKIPQRIRDIGADCTFDFSGNCACYGTTNDVVSGDQMSGDGTFTRKLAIVDKLSMPYPGTDGYIQDCIMRSTGDTPMLATRGEVFVFKIEAVDRQGNLATWPTKLSAVVGPTSFACNGDPCACCLKLQSDFTLCSGLDGVKGPDFPNGVCKSF